MNAVPFLESKINQTGKKLREHWKIDKEFVQERGSSTDPIP
jgi:hypothetical protein